MDNRHPRHDGDPLGWRDGNVICFLTMGEKAEVLNVRATSEPEPPRSMRAQLLEAINTWHRERLWPKAYLVACGIGTPEQFFDGPESQFPDFGSGIPAPPTD